MKRPIRIKIAKLGRQKADGMAFKDNRLIYLDPRLKGVGLLDTAIHEILHCQQPDLSEESVTANAKEMADLLFKLGFRWVDLGG
jgi:hypothetical protein